jgi:hypothetical protein
MVIVIKYWLKVAKSIFNLTSSERKLIRDNARYKDSCKGKACTIVGPSSIKSKILGDRIYLNTAGYCENNRGARDSTSVTYCVLDSRWFDSTRPDYNQKILKMLKESDVLVTTVHNKRVIDKCKHKILSKIVLINSDMDPSNLALPSIFSSKVVRNYPVEIDRPVYRQVSVLSIALMYCVYLGYKEINLVGLSGSLLTKPFAGNDVYQAKRYRNNSYKSRAIPYWDKEVHDLNYLDYSQTKKEYKNYYYLIDYSRHYWFSLAKIAQAANSKKIFINNTNKKSFYDMFI